MISQFLKSECCDAPVVSLLEWVSLSDRVHCSVCCSILGVLLVEDRWKIDWESEIPDDCQ